jgi:hypothetical protein
VLERVDSRLATNSPARITIIVGSFPLNYNITPTYLLTDIHLSEDVTVFVFCIKKIYNKVFFGRHYCLNIVFNAHSPYTLVLNGGNKNYHEAQNVL